MFGGGGFVAERFPPRPCLLLGDTGPRVDAPAEDSGPSSAQETLEEQG